MEQKLIKVLSNHEELGTVVELVEDSDGHRFVTKRISHLETPICRTIFQKEIQALVRLKACENIVRIYRHDIREHENGHTEGIISMEYVQGRPLSKMIDVIPNATTRYQLVKQLTNAIRYAHENSVIHRDINPNNIIVTDEYELKLIDFGVAKIRGMIQEGTAYQFATQNYSAPEVTIHSANASERSDIYSLGAVIFFMFTGIVPPPANQIVEAIENTGGMDVKLKRILCKMCATDPLERFDNIDDCELELSELYQRYCGSEEHYYFSISTTNLDELKQRNLVRKNITYQEMINGFLPSQFVGGSVRIIKREDTIYQFFGISISMDCVLADGLFRVGAIRRLDAYKRDRERKFSMEIPGYFHFVLSHRILGTSLINNYNDILCNRISDFQEEISSRKNINHEYDSQYGIWRQFIQAMIDDASRNATRVFYSGVKQTDGVILLKLEQDCLPDDSFCQETMFVIEQPIRNSNKTRLIEVGTFLEYRDDGTTLAIKVPARRPSLPKWGTICVDYRKEIQQYRRQEAALEEFRKSETNSAGNLKGIFVGVEEPRHFQMLQDLVFFNKQLDLTQKRAVKKVLEADDIALIQGPPGTGKTNVLVEVVRQILKANQSNPALKHKILIVSQSHAAVDKILEDLTPFLLNTTTIRIGSEDKINQDINEHFGLNHCQSLWAMQSVTQCTQRLQELLSKQNIPYDDFCEFAKAVENQHVHNLSDQEKKQNEKIICQFESEYKKTRSTPFVQQCLVMEQWCRRLLESDEIAEYYIKDATIVAGTCTGFISDRYVRDTVFDYVIVDEAAKATLPEIMVALVRAHKVVLVGDHKQLPPVFDREALARNAQEIDITQLQNTGFGKLFDLLPDNCKETLSTQYRMHPCIGDLISMLFYDGKVQNGIDENERQVNLPILNHHAITWISTSQAGNKRFEQLQTGRNMKSYINPTEVTIIQQCLQKIDAEMEALDEDYSIGIITPYRAQLELIHKRLKHTTFKKIKVDINTVDAFQGSQRDIIIYSTVRSSKKKSIGFLREEARLNVSFSRAKRALILVGDAEFLGDQRIRKNPFPYVLQYIRSHPDKCRIIRAEELSNDT